MNPPDLESMNLENLDDLEMLLMGAVAGAMNDGTQGAFLYAHQWIKNGLAMAHKMGREDVLKSMNDVLKETRAEKI